MIFNLPTRRALKTLGGRFSSPWQLASIALHHKKKLDVDVLRFTFFLKKRKRYWFSFCQSPEVNAFAVPLGREKYLLSITSGIASVVYLAAVRLAARSNAFSHLLARDSTSIPVRRPRTRKFLNYWQQYVHSIVRKFIYVTNCLTVAKTAKTGQN